MSEKNRTVWVDMDGTMFDFDNAAIINVPKHLRVERKGFYVAEDYPDSMRQQIEDIYNRPGFFEELEPMPDLMEAWQTMIDSGYQPKVLSAPLTSNPTSIKGKLISLEKHMVPEFGTSVVEQAVFDKRKWKYPGLVLIDDRPNILRGENGDNTAEWEHILFGWRHQQTVAMANTAFRLLGWDETDKLINMLDEISDQKV